jgi:hypothetical protein
MAEITVTVSGPVGCGKSAIAGEIEIALRAVGVPVRFADEKEMRSEKNMTGADWTGDLEMYQPSVVIVEHIPSPQMHVKWPEFSSFGSATAMMDVIDERLRQQRVEGWSLGHDDAHSDGEMARAAGCYAYFGSWSDSDRQKMTRRAPQNWPWDLSWWKPTGRRRDLVKAAALLIAEIERLDRAALATGGKP